MRDKADFHIMNIPALPGISVTAQKYIKQTASVISRDIAGGSHSFSGINRRSGELWNCFPDPEIKNKAPYSWPAILPLN